MYDQLSLTLASLFSEMPFILMVGMIFSICFYFPLGKSTLKHVFKYARDSFTSFS